jgi:hypothetical protein
MKHLDTFKLSAAARGYRVAGKKLLPRDASLYQFGKSNAERRVAIAKEAAHVRASELAFLESVGSKPSRIDAQVERARGALSTRRATYVERVFGDAITSDQDAVFYEAAFLMLGNAQWRYYSALRSQHWAEMARYEDDKLLSYARG